MNIRIQNDQAGAASATTTGRADHVSRSDGSGTRTAGTSGGRGEDQVEVSSLTAGVTAANSAEAASRSQRVRQLGAVVTNGSYNPNSASVSRSIVSAAIGKAL